MTDAQQVISKKATVKKSPVKNVGGADEIIASGGGTVLFMSSPGGSWTTPSGITFSKEYPYQYVPADEVEALLVSGRFRRAEPEEVQKFYNIEL